MVFWDNTNYNSYEMAAKGEDGLAVVAVLYEVRWADCGAVLPNGLTVPPNTELFLRSLGLCGKSRS